MQSNKRNNQNSKSKKQDNYMKQGHTNDRTTWTSMKTGCEIRFSGRVIFSCSLCCTRQNVPYVVLAYKKIRIKSLKWTPKSIATKRSQKCKIKTWVLTIYSVVIVCAHIICHNSYSIVIYCRSEVNKKNGN